MAWGQFYLYLTLNHLTVRLYIVREADSVV
jgi:hypothetical protein